MVHRPYHGRSHFHVAIDHIDNFIYQHQSWRGWHEIGRNARVFAEVSSLHALDDVACDVQLSLRKVSPRLFLFSIHISFVFSQALNVYWLTTNLFSIFQTRLMAFNPIRNALGIEKIRKDIKIPTFEERIKRLNEAAAKSRQE